MSYRSLKRVLGETSLERKCRFLFGACLLLLITASFWWHGSETENLVHAQNRNTGRLLVDQIMYSVHWSSLQNLEVEGRFKDMVSDLTRELSKEEYRWRAILPDRPGNLRDLDDDFQPQGTFEVDLLKRFSREDENGKEPPDRSAEANAVQFDEQYSPDKTEYLYYQPIRAEKNCLVVCHQPLEAGIGTMTNQPALGALGHAVARREGDLMAVIEVTIPNGPTLAALHRNRAILLATAFVTVFLAMIASYVIIRYVIVKPLKHLRDVSDAISHGNITLRADIHTGDEFEALAVAFNRMLRHLVAIQEELRQVNSDLDAKVDELARVNMQLYEMNRLKSDFLATMSHELRTPLNSILGFSDVLGSIDALDDKQKRYVENIQKSGRVLLDMINNILDLAKIESGRVEIRLTDFPIQQVVAAQCDMARPLSEKKNIDLETEIPQGLPPMHQDQARVQQVLNNLLSNAIKFTPEGGRITVSVRRNHDEELEMNVADTGVGIAEEDQQLVFEKFRQGGAGPHSGDAMTREYSGTGLGLSIVKELCRLLDGEVTVQSELGKGSTFTVRIPWVLQRQPPLDSPMADGFEEFTRAGLEFHRELRPARPREPQSAGSRPAAGDADGS
jgi:two-component system sensor histidine kinase BarA